MADESKDKIAVDQQLIRPSEIPDIYGNPEKTKLELGWQYDLDHVGLIDVLLEEELGTMELIYIKLT